MVHLMNIFKQLHQTNVIDLLISISKNPFSLIILLFSPIIGVFYEAFNIIVRSLFVYFAFCEGWSQISWQ